MKNALTAGTVTLTLSGTSHEMACTPKAMLTISRQYGGLQNVVTRLTALDADAACFVVNAGLNRTGKAAEATVEEVFATGLDSVAGACIDFCVALWNGGKTPGADDAKPSAEGNG